MRRAWRKSRPACRTGNWPLRGTGMTVLINSWLLLSAQRKECAKVTSARVKTVNIQQHGYLTLDRRLRGVVTHPRPLRVKHSISVDRSQGRLNVQPGLCKGQLQSSTLPSFERSRPRSWVLKRYLWEAGPSQRFAPIAPRPGRMCSGSARPGKSMESKLSMQKPDQLWRRCEVFEKPYTQKKNPAPCVRTFLWNFLKPAKSLNWNHERPTPHRSETKGVAERAVRRVKEGSSSVLVQCGPSRKPGGQKQCSVIAIPEMCRTYQQTARRLMNICSIHHLMGRTFLLEQM